MIWQAFYLQFRYSQIRNELWNIKIYFIDENYEIFKMMKNNKVKEKKNCSKSQDWSVSFLKCVSKYFLNVYCTYVEYDDCVLDWNIMEINRQDSEFKYLVVLFDAAST